MTILADAMPYLRATAFLVAIWSTVAQLEWIANHAAFRPGGRFAVAARTRALRPFARVATRRGFAAMTVVRLTGAALLLVAVSPDWLALGFLLTLAGALAMTFALGLGDGSDKFGQIVAAAGLLAALGVWRDDPALAFAGVLLAGGQLIVCYAVSGVAKLRRPDWRSGRVLHEVMRSGAFGHPHAARMTRHPARSLVLAWSVMLAEVLFPLTLIAPAPVLRGAIAVFLLFHWATAYVMGLNTFAWAFPAAFPAVLLLGAAARAQVY